MTDRRYWVAFSAVRGIGPSRLRGLLTHFENDLARAWHASSVELLAAGLGEKALHSFLDFRRKTDPEALLNHIQKLNIALCTIEDDNYPALLRKVDDAPILLYLKGQLFPEDNRALAVVGTRNATHYGHEVTKNMTTALSQAGVTIVSGLARGLDTTAHRAALETGGRTIAVLGSGLDIIYPEENMPLAQKIVESYQGVLISEYPPGTPPDPRHFPARNRIISGLSLGVLIAEAPAGSGALLTADSAMEQGREVFAIPGNITSRNSQGTNRLIQQGAKMVLEPSDVLDELRISYTLMETGQATELIMPSNATEIALLRIIANEPVHIDEIAIQASRSIQDISAILTLMELKGLVQQIGAMFYQVSSAVDLDALLD